MTRVPRMGVLLAAATLLAACAAPNPTVAPSLTDIAGGSVSHLVSAR